MTFFVYDRNTSKNYYNLFNFFIIKNWQKKYKQSCYRLPKTRYLFLKETKDFYFNPLNKIKWGPDEHLAPDFALNSY